MRARAPVGVSVPVPHPLRARRARRERLALLADDEPVDVPCRVRRTTTRGWGPWTTGTVLLGAPGGTAEWQVDDPAAVGLTWAKGRRPSPFVEVETVGTRPVRFREEAFAGMANEIVVVSAERSTTEVAVPPDELDHVVRRLRALLLGDG